MCMIHPVASVVSWFMPWTWLPPRVHVASTRIFARHEGTRQSIVYDLRLRSRTDAVMVLPIPVVPSASESAVRFIDMSPHPKFLDALEALFVEYDRPIPARGKGGYRSPVVPKLEVHRVGAYEASFVPTLRDFARLDASLRFDDSVWAQLPAYADYGFAVFRLRAGDARIHPMAFWFETRDPARVFFPTVHVHDGKVKPQARFDHALYFQLAGDTRSHDPTRASAQFGFAREWPGVMGGELLLRETRIGRLPNDDAWIARPAP